MPPWTFWFTKRDIFSFRAPQNCPSQPLGLAKCQCCHAHPNLSRIPNGAAAFLQSLFLSRLGINPNQPVSCSCDLLLVENPSHCLPSFILMHESIIMRIYLINAVVLLLAVAVSAADELHRSLRGPPEHANGPPDHAQNHDQEETFHTQALKVVEGDDDNDKQGRASEGDNPKDTEDRFSKWQMYDGKPKPDMNKKDAYPMSDEVAELLRYHSSAYSVVTTHDYEMKGHDVTDYIAAVGGYPPRPSTDPNDEYWDEFRFMCKTQWERRNGTLPTDPDIWTPPDLWKDDDVYKVCEKVHNEYPGKNQAELLERWYETLGRRGVKLDATILPFRCVEDFIGTEVRLAALNTWAISSTYCVFLKCVCE